MNSTLAYLRGRRSWMVENFTVWGTDSEAEFLMAMTETIGSEKRVGFWRATLGGQSQSVAFSSLTDNRGNSLPAQIKKPVVIVIPRGKKSAFITAVQGDFGFAVAKAENDSPSVTVDLLIFETGL